MLGARGRAQGLGLVVDGAVYAAGYRHPRQALLLQPLQLQAVCFSALPTVSGPVGSHTPCRPTPCPD